MSQRGDVTVATTLGYGSIYLVAPNGNLYQFEGISRRTNQARTQNDLHALSSVSTDIPASSVVYLVDPNTNNHFPVAASH